MVEWCTQNLRQNGSISRGTSHATTTERYQYTTSVDINNTCCKRLQSLIQNHMPMCAVSLLESREYYYINAMNNNMAKSYQMILANVFFAKAYQIFLPNVLFSLRL